MKMPRLLASNLLLIRFPAVLAVFAVMMVVGDWNITRTTQGISLQLFNSARFEEATRAEMELNDLLGKSYRYAHGDAGIAEADVTLAMDVFWSRIETLRTSSYRDALADAGVTDGTIVAELADALPRLEQAVHALGFGKPESFAGMGALAMRYQSRLLDYSDKAYSARRAQMRNMVEKGVENLDNLKSLQLENTGFACLTFLYVLFELYLSRRVNRKLNASVEEKHHLLISDHLTGIRNRRHFETALQDRPVDGDHAVLLVDLDNFKGVNDTLGHAAGDALLRHVASVLKSASRDGDIVSRLGGDEFAVLVAGPMARAQEYARAALAGISQPVLFDGQRISGSASIGVAHSSEVEEGTSASDLMKSADIALYAAKGAGRNCVRFTTPQIMSESNRKHRLQKDLALAISEGQIEVEYQPIVAMNGGETKGIEALVRWHHPEFGQVPPPQIIDAAEQTNQILPLTLYVANLACGVRSHLAACGHDLQVTVNVTPGLLNLAGFADAITSVARRHDIQRGQLLLELTEDAMMAENETVDCNIAHFRSAGVFLAVDDFGKGYSNLSRLASLEFRKIKLDKSLIDHVVSSTRSLDIARSISRMASDLGINVIAEGVETADQQMALQDLGIPLAQGFFFARPMNALSLLAHLGRPRTQESSPDRVAG